MTATLSVDNRLSSALAVNGKSSSFISLKLLLAGTGGIFRTYQQQKACNRSTVGIL